MIFMLPPAGVPQNAPASAAPSEQARKQTRPLSNHREEAAGNGPLLSSLQSGTGEVIDKDWPIARSFRGSNGAITAKSHAVLWART